MKILAIERERPNVSGEKFRPHLKAEAMKVWELNQNGLIREIYFGQADHNAVIIMECKDIPEARAILQTLPLVREGLINFEVIALEPYSGFSRLFAGSQG